MARSTDAEFVELPPALLMKLGHAHAPPEVTMRTPLVLSFGLATTLALTLVAPARAEVASPAAAPPPTAPSPPRQARLTLATHSRAVATLVTACANALDNDHPELARDQCRQAIQQEETLAFAHYLLAQAVPPKSAQEELARASLLEKTASRGEQLFIDAFRARAAGHYGVAKELYDQLLVELPGDARAHMARGQFCELALGDPVAAVNDYRAALALDSHYPAAYGRLGLALAAEGQLDEATAALDRYQALAPKESNALVTRGKLALLHGDAAEAAKQAQAALTMDPHSGAAQALLGDALLFAGKGAAARKAYGSLMEAADPTLRHEGAMRAARSWLFEGRESDCERALAAEVEWARQHRWPGDQAEALVELARVQLDRAQLAAAGQSLRQLREALGAEVGPRTSLLQRREVASEAQRVSAMILGAIGEPQLAAARAEQMGAALELAEVPRAGQQATALKGWIAARNGDDRTALGELAHATRPTLRMALALAAARAGDLPRAETIMEALAQRQVNDLEGALTRARAAAWLKAHPTVSQR